MFYLGTIAVGSGAAKNNHSTAVPFAIPVGCGDLALESDTSGVQFEFGVGNSFATTATRGAFLKTAQVTQGPYKTGDIGVTVSVWNPTGGNVNVKVYSVPG